MLHKRLLQKLASKACLIISDNWHAPSKNRSCHFRARKHFLVFFGVLNGTKIGMNFAALTQYENFEANEMSTKYMKFLTPSDSAVMPSSLFVDVPIVSILRNFETINKTWHADCRKPAVSKILDWLVK